jgi:hypothetical protein
VVRHITINLKDSVSLTIQDFQSVVVGTWLVQIHGKQMAVEEWANIVGVLIVGKRNALEQMLVAVVTKQSGEEKQSRLVKQLTLMTC